MNKIRLPLLLPDNFGEKLNNALIAKDGIDRRKRVLVKTKGIKGIFEKLILGGKETEFYDFGDPLASRFKSDVEMNIFYAVCETGYNSKIKPSIEYNNSGLSGICTLVEDDELIDNAIKEAMLL